MSEVIATANGRTITVNDVEKMAARGSSMSSLLSGLESDRILSFVKSKNIIEPTHKRKWNGFVDVCSLLKEIGVPDDQIIYDPIVLRRLRYYYNGERNEKDYIYFKVGKGEHPTPTVFFRRSFSDTSYGCRFGAFKKDDLIDLIKEFPIKCAQWDEENQVIIRIYEKYDKIRKMAQTSIRILVENELKRTNYKYSIEEGKTRSVLVVKMRRQRKLEISLRHKDFQKVIGQIPEIIDRIMTTSDDIKADFKITRAKETVKA